MVVVAGKEEVEEHCSSSQVVGGWLKVDGSPTIGEDEVKWWT